MNRQLNQWLARAGRLQDLCSIVDENLNEFNIVNCSTALGVFAKLSHPSSVQSKAQRSWTTATLGPLLRHTVTLLEKEGDGERESRHVSSILLAASKLRQSEAVREVASAAVSCANADRKLVAAFKPHEISIAVSALGKLGRGHNPVPGSGTFIQSLLDRIESERLQLLPQGVSCLWLALGSLEHRFATRPQLLVGQTQRMLRQLSAQELVNVTSGLAKLDGVEVDGSFFGAAVGAAARVERALSARQVANLYWAMGRLSERRGRGGGKGSSETLCRAALRHAGAFNGQDLDNISAALVRLGPAHCHDRLMEVLTERSKDQVGRIAPRNLSNIVYSLAKVERPAIGAGARGAGGLACAVSEYLLAGSGNNVGRFNARDLSNLAWGLAGIASGDGPVDAALEAIAEAATAKLESFNAQECSKLLYALRRRGVRSARLEEAAGANRESAIALGQEIGEVRLCHILAGGRNLEARREATGATGATGGALWQDSRLLAEWLASFPHGPTSDPAVAEVMGAKMAGRWDAAGGWRGKVAVELGAGLGLCSIAAGLLGMTVVATDGDDSVLELMKANVDLNRERLAARGGKVSVRKLAWGTPRPLEALGLASKPDVILATGVVYGKDPTVWESLAQTIDDLSGKRPTLVVMAHGNGAAPGVHQMRGVFYERMLARFQATRLVLPNPSGHQGCQLHALRKLAKRHRGSAADSARETKRARHG